ncbi:triose-phosphate isomerase [Candidatus Wolfebacteria bacterium RIFOXYD12_FULL_48_21]|nr:MAG: triose-phosphate isomerase [Candidatus Wolfebacteria bacterium RIFOXYD12_FULL_48_21]OGM96846.1 MAG: triose-phosphate isomerase [Candidatus Wolfebacteria bacterium RIFOXYD2_FULL_48_11]
MKKLIAFNWKMYPKKAADIEGLLLAFDDANIDTDRYEIAIAPPAVYLPMIADIFYEVKADISLAMQNCAWQSEGALTGEISAEMGKNVGADYAIIGHSERRMHLGETDEVVNKKVKAAMGARLGVILCVGEPIEVRKQGIVVVKKYIKRQIDGALHAIEPSSYRGIELCIAYEPIWAIGTGKAATPEDAVEVIAFIRSILNTNYGIPTARILYGGSVNAKNVTLFVEHDGIDGALVGGASINKKELKSILKTLHS